MSRIAALFALALALVTAGTSAQSSTTLPSSGRGAITYTSNTMVGGRVHVTGDVVSFGGLIGFVTGTDSRDIDPLTGILVGGGSRRAADGSTYMIQFSGQLISAGESIGTCTVFGGTGRFANPTGQGTWSNTRWSNQLGGTIRFEGTVTLQH